MYVGSDVPGRANFFFDLCESVAAAGVASTHYATAFGM